MKYALSALALAAVGAGAALAASPQFPSSPAYSVSAGFSAPSNVCDLRVNDPRMIAYANPSHAASWSLFIEAPGFVNQQSGPVTGDSTRLRPVTRLLMGGLGVDEAGRLHGGSRSLPRPFYAELTVYDVDGAVICTDIVDLTAGARLGSPRPPAGLW